MTAFNVSRVKPVWFRAWMVASMVWIAAATLNGFPIRPAEPTFETVESLVHPSVANLRQNCTRYNTHVEMTMADELFTICFRSSGGRDVYLRWFGEANESYVKKENRENVVAQIIIALSGFVFIAIALLAAEWVFRGAGKGFLLIEQPGSTTVVETNALMHSFNRERLQAAIPIIGIVGLLWGGIPLLVPWESIRNGLEAYGPASAGVFLTGSLVLLYRKTLHPLITAGAFFIYILPAALLFYGPLQSAGFDFLLFPFVIGCIELARYLGPKLQQPSGRYLRLRWQFLIFVSTLFVSLISMMVLFVFD